jgi:hypothetical protein
VEVLVVDAENVFLYAELFETMERLARIERIERFLPGEWPMKEARREAGWRCW